MTFDPVAQAAQLIASSDALLITAGAGMGVDSGLPDFRGKEGFWKAYPALANACIDFKSIANSFAFHESPRLAWGFYGHRLALYRKTEPHIGFSLLRRMGEAAVHGAFVVTSNVDGQFQKASFPEARVLEIHGSIHYLQCCTPCRDTVWSAQYIEPETDDARCDWIGSQLPSCQRCGQLARPNILMFDDWVWLSSRIDAQHDRFNAWLGQTSAPVVLELGAGIDLPSIRRISESRGYPLIRINPHHPAIPEGLGVSLQMGARQGLSLIIQALEEIGWLEPYDKTVSESPPK
jgi:NAD-dependent SIR2 family protein deacetylase